jgi:hypothetical protein
MPKVAKGHAGRVATRALPFFYLAQLTPVAGLYRIAGFAGKAWRGRNHHSVGMRQRLLSLPVILRV